MPLGGSLSTTLSPFGVTAKLSPILKLTGESLASNFWAGVSVPPTRACRRSGHVAPTAADQGGPCLLRPVRTHVRAYQPTTTLSPFGVTAKLSPIYKLVGESLASNKGILFVAVCVCSVALYI